MEKARRELEAMIRDLCPGEGISPVYGEGRRGAGVMLIGEAPGGKEAALGRPFVGKAGESLNGFLEDSGLKREDMYVTNTVKIRPMRVSASGRVSNRPPTREEIRLFLPFLRMEIEDVDPRWIVTLGNVPLQALTGSRETVGTVHGQAREWNGCMLYPMYHPASMIYNPSLRTAFRDDAQRLSRLLSGDRPAARP